MGWGVRQTRRFGRAYKKLYRNVWVDVDEAVRVIAENPDVGERKRGDLSELFVYKFHSQNQLYLLGYTRNDKVCLIYLEAVGPHENFCRDLKPRFI